MAAFAVFLTAREKVRVTVNLDEIKLVVAAAELDGVPDECAYGTLLVLNTPDGWDGSLIWNTFMLAASTGTALHVATSISDVLQLLKPPAAADEGE